MMERYRRCKHCQDVYTYQLSGCRGSTKLNDPTYCPPCKGAIDDTLERIPLRVKELWEDYSGITIDEINEELSRRDEEIAKEGGIPFRRVLVPLFDMADPENRNIAGELVVDGKTIMYSYWTKSGDISIKVKKFRHTESGKEGLWIDYEQD